MRSTISAKFCLSASCTVLRRVSGTRISVAALAPLLGRANGKACANTDS